MAQEYFELANVLDGSMTPDEAREYYKKSIGDLYGVSVYTPVSTYIAHRRVIYGMNV